MRQAGPDTQNLHPLMAVLLLAALGSSLLGEYAGLLGLPAWMGPAVALATALLALGALWRQRTPRSRYVFLFMSAQAGAALAGSVFGS